MTSQQNLGNISKEHLSSDEKYTIYSSNGITHLKNGKYHNEYGPALEFIQGAKYWYINGALHREDGPAIESGRNKWWYLHGKKYDGEFTNESWKSFQRLMIF